MSRRGPPPTSPRRAHFEDRRALSFANGEWSGPAPDPTVGASQRLLQARSSGGLGGRVLQASVSAEAEVRRGWMRIVCSRLPSSVDVAGVASCSHQGEQKQRFAVDSCQFFFRLRSSAGVAGVGSCSTCGAQKETCVQRVPSLLRARSPDGVVAIASCNHQQGVQAQRCAAV
jgi:hypothetical protein